TGHCSRQPPLRQTSPLAQAWPQLPQLRASVVVSAQPLPQTTWPLGQRVPHAPPPHTWPVAQGAATPPSASASPGQPPQLAGSFRVSTQAPPHSLRSAGQLSTQVPLLQISPEPQAFDTDAVLQAPQLARSVRASTHLPDPAGHSVRLAGQVVLQMPETHCSPAPHLVPQAPQFAESRLTSMQLPLQLVRPVRHSIAQCPAPPPAGGV